MTAAHSPIPWTAERDLAMFMIRAPGRSMPIAEVLTAGDDDELVANANLMTAAPELLELARGIAATCAECHGARCVDCADIWMVIDKAEGRA